MPRGNAQIQTPAQHTYCAFTVGNLRLGLSVAYLTEVLRVPLLTRVPLTVPCVRGLMNLRGQIITVLDLAVCLGVSPQATGTDQRQCIVAQVNTLSVAFLVDQVVDIVDTTNDANVAVPATVNHRLRNVIEKVVCFAEGLLLVLDVMAVLAAADNPRCQGETRPL